MFDIPHAPRVLVQGITGAHGRAHTKAMLAVGTQITAGVVPGGEGKAVHGVPVYNTIARAQEHSAFDVSIVFVPAQFCKEALLEAVQAHITLIVCITEVLLLTPG